MTRLHRGVVLLVGLAAAGCGGGTADLSGTVRYNGKPVVYGTVVVLGPDGSTHNGAIQPDGTYRVADIAAGAVKVMVSSPPPPGVKGGRKAGGRDAIDDERGPPPDEAVSPEVVKGWVKLPDKYSVPEQTDLTLTLKPGPNAQDLELR